MIRVTQFLTNVFAVTKFLVTTGFYWETNEIVSQSEVLEVTSEGGHPCQNWVDMKVSLATGGLVGNTPLICGGISFTSSISNTCFSLKENDVRATAQMLANRTYAASIVHNEHFLWITGGWDMELSLIHSSSEFIQAGKNNSIAGTDLPRPLQNHAMVVVEKDLTMVIGGFSLNGADGSDITYYYDHSSQQWAFGPPLITGRYSHATFIVTDEASDENIIIVAGGWNWGSLNSTEILKDDKWIRGTNNFNVIL